MSRFSNEFDKASWEILIFNRTYKNQEFKLLIDFSYIIFLGCENAKSSSH